MTRADDETAGERMETVLHLNLPAHVWGSVKRAAARDCLTPTQYVRRFLAINLDVIDPQGGDDD